MKFEQEVLQRLTKVETILAEHTKQDTIMHKQLEVALNNLTAEVANLKIKNAVIGVKMGFWGGLAGTLSTIAVVVTQVLM